MKREQALAIAAALLCLGTTPWTATAAEMGTAPLADKLPEGTLLYIGWPGASRFAEASKDTALAKLLAEPEVIRFRESLTRQVIPAVEEIILSEQGPGPWAGLVDTVKNLLGTFWEHPTTFALVGVQMGEAGPQVDVALMIDTMGEARMTAAMAGAYGFKPSYGTISRFGLIGLVPSMECCAVVARSPHDVAALTALLVGADERDPAMRHDAPADDPAPAAHQEPVAVAGVLRECLDMLEPAEADSFRAALATIEAAGVPQCLPNSSTRHCKAQVGSPREVEGQARASAAPINERASPTSSSASSGLNIPTQTVSMGLIVE